MARGRPSRQKVIEALDLARADLTVIGGLPEPTVFQDVWADIWTEETHHSTALEGNTLRLKQVQMLLEDETFTGSQANLREILEARAYGEAAKWVYEYAYGGRWNRPDTLITEPDIRRIHELVVGIVWTYFPPEGLKAKESPGAYRLGGHEPLRPGLTPTPFDQVPSLLADWVKEANDADWEPECHSIERLAYLHAAFERIHPFPDGNGRVGRLVLTLLLVRHGYPPAIIYKDERQKYLRSLERADDGDTGPLSELLARSVTNGIHRFLIPSLAGKLSVVPIAGLADESISRGALKNAAQRGRLQAHKIGDGWYSTQKWVTEYKKNRYRPS